MVVETIMTLECFIGYPIMSSQDFVVRLVMDTCLCRAKTQTILCRSGALTIQFGPTRKFLSDQEQFQLVGRSI